MERSLNPLEAAAREGAADADAGRPPRKRDRGNHTKIIHNAYLTGYRERAGWMMRFRRHAQLTLDLP